MTDCRTDEKETQLNEDNISMSMHVTNPARGRFIVKKRVRPMIEPLISCLQAQTWGYRQFDAP